MGEAKRRAQAQRITFADAYEGIKDTLDATRLVRSQPHQARHVLRSLGWEKDGVAVAAETAERLAQVPAGDRSRELALQAGAMFDDFTARCDKSVIACRKGCHHCCAHAVSITEHEAALIAWNIEDELEIQAVFLARAEERKGWTPMDFVRSDTFCPLLDPADGTCRIYDNRPLACRAYASADVEACATAASSKLQQARVPMPGWTVEAQVMVEGVAGMLAPTWRGEMSQMVARELEKNR